MESNGLPISIRTSPANPHTKRTQRQFHKTRIKNIMAKQDLLLKDFLHGSNVDFIELQSDMRGIVIIILDLFTWHQF